MVREGYKETELGEIPVEWGVGNVSDYCCVILSNVDKKTHPKEIPVLLCNYLDVFNNDYITHDIRFMKASATISEIQKYSITKNDVLITKDSETAEEIAITTAVIEDCSNVLCGYHLAIIRPKSDTFNGIFLSKSLNHAPIHRQFVRGAKGVTRYGLNKSEIENAIIPLPPLPEQRRIAAVLSTIDEAIEKTESLIAKLRQVKAGLMQDLLTKGIDEEGRVRSEETHAFKDSEIGRVPVEWEVPELGEIYSEFKTGSTPRRNQPDYFKGDILWITSGELKFKPIVTTKEKITAEAVNNTNLRIYPPGTFFIAITGLEADGTRGSCAINLKEATTNQSCMAFYENSKLNTNYFYQYYRYFGEDLIFKYAHGTKQQSLNASIVRSIRIKMPSKEEQHRIAAILTAADDRIAREETYRDKLLAMKKGLMADLLTGRVRVPKGKSFNL